MQNAIVTHRQRKVGTSRRILDASERRELRTWLQEQIGLWTPGWAREPLVSWKGATCISKKRRLTITCLRAAPSASLDTHLERLLTIVQAGYDMLAAAASSVNETRVVPPEAHIVYLPHQRKRSLPVSGAITPEHINGGMTTFHYQPSAQKWRILVYRKEDAAKVMLHELVHLFKLDGPQLPESQEAQWAQQRIPRDLVRVVAAPPIARLNIQEAVTETLACYLYAVATCKSKLSECCGRMGNRLDSIAAGVLAASNREILDGTHAFAYMIGRAVLWDGKNGPCREFFDLLMRGDNRDLLGLLEARMPMLFRRIDERRRPPSKSLVIEVKNQTQ